MGFWERLFFPTFCVGCGKPGDSLCFSCFQKRKPFFPQRCLLCNKPSYLGLIHKKEQRKKVLIFGAYSIYVYKHPLTTLIKKVKYAHQHKLLADFLTSIPPSELFNLWEIKHLFTNSLLVPIPLYQKDRVERGFNQAEILANFFSKILKIPVVNLVTKIRSTKKQSLLSDKERRKNINQAFVVSNKKYRHKEIILVDDIITTGSTIFEVAEILTKAQYNRIYAISLFGARPTF